MGLWLVLKTVFEYKRSCGNKNWWKEPYFKSLFAVLFLAIALFPALFFPAAKSGLLSLDYLIKYIQCVFALIGLLLFCNATINKYVIKSVVFLSVCFSLFLLFGFFIPRVRNKAYTGAVTYNLGNPNTSASVLMYNSLVLLYGAFIVRSKVLRIILSLLSVAIIVLVYSTQSRNPYVAIIFALVFALVYYFFRKFKSRRIIAPLVLVASVLFFSCVYFLYYYFSTHGAPAQSVTETAFGKGYSTRYAVWTDAFKKIGEHFLLGNYYSLQGTFQYHNSILDIFVAYGFIGGTMCSSVLIYILYSLVFANNRIVISQKVAFVCFLAFFYTGLFEASFFNSPQGICVLFFSFISFSKVPLTNDCVSENNALYFNQKTFKKCDILLINSVYQKGSTGKLVNTIFDYSTKQYKTICLYGRKRGEAKLNVAKCCTEFQSKLNHLINLVTKDPYLFNLSSTFEIIRVIKKYKPKIVHIHNLNDYYVNQYLLLKFLKKNSINTIVTLHSENIYVGCQEGHVFECEGWTNGKRCNNCGYFKNKSSVSRKWRRMNRTIEGFKNLEFTAVSPWLAERAHKSTLLSKFNINIVQNGVDSSYFQSTSDSIKEKTNKNVLFVCADSNNPLKGFNYFLELAKFYEGNPNLNFILLSLEENLHKNLPKNVIAHKPIKNVLELKALYESASVSLVLSKRETFSMPVAESLSCGTPVVGFNCGGAESICLTNYCSFVKYGDLCELRRSLDFILKKDFDSAEIRREAEKYYSASIMWSKYDKLYSALLKTIYFEIDL